MAKHRAPSQLSTIAISLPLFLAALALASLFNFVQVGQGRIPIAVPPTGSTPEPSTSAPSTSAPPAGTKKETSATTSVQQSAPVNNVYKSIVPIAQSREVVQTSTPQMSALISKPIQTPIITIPSTTPTTPTKSQLLALDSGVKVNVPLLKATLGIKLTLAPTK